VSPEVSFPFIVVETDPAKPSERPSIIYSRESKRLFVSDTKELRIVETQEEIS